MPKGEKKFRLRGIDWRWWLRLFFYYLLISGRALAENRRQLFEDSGLMLRAYDLIQLGQIEKAQSICEQILEENPSVTDVQKAVLIYWEAAQKSIDFTQLVKVWNFVERARNLYQKDSIISTAHSMISLRYYFWSAKEQILNNDFAEVVKSLDIIEKKLSFLSGEKDFNYYSSEFSNIRALYHAAQYKGTGKLEREDTERIYKDCKNVVDINYDIKQVEDAVNTFFAVRNFFEPDDLFVFFGRALVKRSNSSLIYLRYFDVLAELGYMQKSLEMARAAILSYINEKDSDHKRNTKSYVIKFCDTIGLTKYCTTNGLSIEDLSEEIVFQYFEILLSSLESGQPIQQQLFAMQKVESYMPTKGFVGDMQVLSNKRQKSNSVIKVIIAAVISGFAFLLWQLLRRNERVALPMVTPPRIRSRDSTTSESCEVSPELHLSDLRNQWETLQRDIELQLDSYNNFVERINDFDFKLMDYDEIVRIAERAIRYRKDDCPDITSRLQRSLDILLRLKADWGKNCSVEVAQEKYAALQEAYQHLSELEFSIENIEQIEGGFSRLREVSNDYSSYKRDGEYALTEGPKLLAKLNKVRNSIGQKLDELEKLADQETVRNRMLLPFFNGENRQVNDNDVQPCGDIPRFER